MKRPAFQFYPADWVKDPALRSCSLAARGLWMELICMAHESEKYGYLVVNGTAITDKQLVTNIGGASMKLLHELEAAAVFSRDKRGAIYSRRMVKDERLRQVRSAAGKLGGNPSLINQNSTTEDNQEVDVSLPPKQANAETLNEKRDKQKPTPSSSSSSSSSSKSEVGVTPPTVAAVDNSVSKVKFANENNEIPTQKLTAGQQWDDPAWVNATATTVGKTHLSGESFPDFRDRVYGAVQAKFAEAKRVAK